MLMLEKLTFCREEVDVVGLHLGWETYQPAANHLSAIKEFSMPDQPTITNTKSWYGLVSQLAPSMVTAPVMEPLHDLL